MTNACVISKSKYLDSGLSVGVIVMILGTHNFLQIAEILLVEILLGVVRQPSRLFGYQI